MASDDLGALALRLLADLTPGGSEYHNNPQRCAEWVQARLENAQRLTVKAYKDRNAARSDRAALEAENARLKTALGVISVECQHWADIVNDAGESNIHARHANLARAALAAPAEQGGEGEAP